MDMSKMISPKSSQLNADDLVAGPMVITITGVKQGPSAEQPVAVSFDGDSGKPYLPCLSMRRVMIHCWGADAHQYAGRSLKLFLDPAVKFGGMAVGGIRISHASHIDGRKTMALTSSKARRSPYSVDVLEVQAAPEASEELITEGQNASAGGTDSLKTFWSALGGTKQKLLAGHLDGWKKVATDIDEMTGSE